MKIAHFHIKDYNYNNTHNKNTLTKCLVKLAIFIVKHGEGNNENVEKQLYGEKGNLNMLKNKLWK